MIRKNIPIKFNKEVSEELRKLYQLPVVVIDCETTGNNWQRHGLLSAAAMDFFNPEKNFYAECHLADNCQISQVDIKKNEFGRETNLTRIINPQGNYPDFDEEFKPFIEPNERPGYKGEGIRRYLELRRLAETILRDKTPGTGFIQTSEKDLVTEILNWMRSDYDHKELTHLILEGSMPVVTPLGHNVGFDVAFLDNAYYRARIGDEKRKIIKFADDDKREYREFKPFSFAYRGQKNVAEMVEGIIVDKCDPDEVKDFWYKSRTAKGQRVLLPTFGGQSGLTLDACAEFVGLKPRQNTSTGAAHDALEDVMITAEIAARARTGKTYLEQFDTDKTQPSKFVRK